MPSAPATQRRTTVLLLLGLILATLIAFARVPFCNFVSLDDGYYVTANGNVQHPLDIGSLLWALKPDAYWIPVTWLSLMLDSAVWGIKPFGFHLTNLLIHAANVGLLYWFLCRATGSPWRSALAAALFGLHPLRVESVAWVTERKDVLSAFFGLWGLGVYVSWSRETGATTMRRAAGYALILLLFALSLWSKPMLVTLPFLLLLLDGWPLKRLAGAPNDGLGPVSETSPRSNSIARLVLEKVPLLAMAIAFSMVTIWGQRHTGAVRDDASFALSVRLANAVVSYARYLQKSFWFASLAVPYPYPDSWPVPLVVGSVLLLLAITAVAIWRGRPNPWLLVGWLWFLGTLVPVIGVIQSGDQSMADRFTYFPSIGLCIMLAWSIPAAGGVIAAAALVLLGAFSFIQTGYWHDSTALFEHAAKVTEGNYDAHNYAGAELAAQNRLNDAVIHFQQAVKINPNYADGHFNLGRALAEQKQYAQAAFHLEKALELRPGYTGANSNLAFVYLSMGRPHLALPHARRALELAPGDAKATNFLVIAHQGLAGIYHQRGQLKEALDELLAARQLRPDDANIAQSVAALRGEMEQK